MKKKFSRLDYCQYLLSSPINYTLTNFADHSENLSHDKINRYLKSEKLSPRLVWEHVKNDVITSDDGYVLFDDTVIDKNHSFSIENARYQYSGNAHDVIKGIGVVTCIYVNPDLNKFWIIDYRIFDPDIDGKSKIDHLTQMLKNVIYQKNLNFPTVLFDAWYATMPIILMCEDLGKKYYCPLRKNRLVDDSSGEKQYQQIVNLDWSDGDLKEGKVIKIKKFPKNHKVKLFRVTISTNRTEHIITNDMSQNSTDNTRKECAIRWKIEEFHREIKQLTGIEKCQCRKNRIQRNHIACSMLVWVKLKQVANKTSKTVYQIKHGLLRDYWVQQLKSPVGELIFA